MKYMTRKEFGFIPRTRLKKKLGKRYSDSRVISKGFWPQILEQKHVSRLTNSIVKTYWKYPLDNLKYKTCKRIDEFQSFGRGLDVGPNSAQAVFFQLAENDKQIRVNIIHLTQDKTGHLSGN